MRLPWLQIDADGMTRGEMLGRLLGIGPDAGIGLALRLWRWALEMSPEGDFSGGAHDPRNVAAGVGWSPDEAEKLCGELVLTGLAEMPVGAGFARIRGLERYRRAWEKNKRRKPALVVPVTGKNPAGTGAEPARKTETETETETENQKKKIAGKKPPAPPKPESPPDPRHRPLVDALVAATPGYTFQGGRDAKAVTQLLALADATVESEAAHAEVVRRWLRAWGRTGYPTVRTLSELVTHWNHFATAGPALKNAPTNPDQDFPRGILNANPV